MRAAAIPAPNPSLVSTLLELTKLRISAASTSTAAAGYVACLRGSDAGLVTTLLGILFLAMGASALNQYQERHYDTRMRRTWHRPVPTGDLSSRAAVAIACGLAVCGFLVLLLAHNLASALCGALAMIWYNAFYTPLKRVSAFAVVPGALIGALPPVIGWAAAGGDVFDPAILALAFVFFVWQVPHFWMLVAIHGEGYEEAGFPTVVKVFGRPRLARLSFTWICGTAAACALLPMFRVILGLPSLLLLAGAACWLVYGGAVLLRPGPDAPVFRRAFVNINVFALLLTAAVILDPFLAR